MAICNSHRDDCFLRPSPGSDFCLLFMSRARFSPADDNAPAEKATQKIINVPAEGFVWPNQPPKDCPFEQSKQLAGCISPGRITRGITATRGIPPGRPTATCTRPCRRHDGRHGGHFHRGCQL